MRAAASRPHARRTVRAARTRRSDSESLPLPPERLAQVAKLVPHEPVDALARLAHRVADLPLQSFGRDPIHQLAASIARPARARDARSGGTPPGQLGAAHHRRDRPASRGAAPQQQRRRRTDRGADERRGEQIVLRLTPSLGGAGGLADAWPPAWAARHRRSHPPLPPSLERTRSARPRPRCEARPPPCAPRAPSTPSR